MESSSADNIVPQPPLSSPPCERCHLATLPQYYFCPNCGNNLRQPPLSTGFTTQLWMYMFSLILPSLCFLFITKWQGMRYARSNDPKTKRIGLVACTLLIISTVLTFWFAYSAAQKILQASVGMSSDILEN